MRYLRDQEGIALIMVMIISTIALAIMSALIYMLTVGTQISGMQKRYSTAFEAGVGGEGVVFEFIGTRGAPSFANGISMATNITNSCIVDKLTESTANWGSGCDSTLIVNATINDFQFDLGKYRVYAKIINTIQGNSGAADIGLKKTGVVAANSGEVTVQGFPFFYVIEVDARNTRNTSERSRLSILYQY
jgi:hypothetical protein